MNSWHLWGFPGGSDGKEFTCNAGDLDSILGWEDPLEEGMATHSSILAWSTPWTEEPGGLQFTLSQRVGHDWATKHSTAQLGHTAFGVLYIFQYSKLTIKNIST